MTHSVGWIFSQNFSSLALPTWESVWKIFWLKDDLVNESMNHKPVYRTAPATPGLLITYLAFNYNKDQFSRLACSAGQHSAVLSSGQSVAVVRSRAARSSTPCNCNVLHSTAHTAHCTVNRNTALCGTEDYCTVFRSALYSTLHCTQHSTVFNTVRLIALNMWGPQLILYLRHTTLPLRWMC